MKGKRVGPTICIVDFPIGFCQRLSGLIDQYLCKVVAVLVDQLMPFKQLLGSSSRIHFSVVQKGLVRGLDSCINVFYGIIWCCCPRFSGPRVYDIKSVSRFGFDPFAIDIRAVFE